MKPLPEVPRCPFCYHRIEQPRELKERKIIEFPLGVCEYCGAVYAYDATGHNRGAAFIEALLFACNEDDYLAFSLSYGDDYDDAVIEKYDLISHTITPENTYQERYIRGALIFVKLKDQYQEITKDKIKERIKNSIPVLKTKLRSEKFSKEKVKEYVFSNNTEELISLSKEDSRVINELQRMLYTPDETLRWKVINIISQVCESISDYRPDIVSKFLSRLIQDASYPGASAWGALETAGAIISTNISLFEEFSPALLSFLNINEPRKDVIWAIGKIASISREPVKYAFRRLEALISNNDPEIRGYAIWTLGNMGYEDIIEEIEKHLNDNVAIKICRDSELESITISQLANEAIMKLKKNA